MIKIFFFGICATVLSAYDFDPEQHKNWNLLPHDVCGQVESERIIGGVEAPMNAFPWLARIGYVSPNSEEINFLCGGALANSKTVLTAAHCVADLPNEMNVSAIAEIRQKFLAVDCGRYSAVYVHLWQSTIVDTPTEVVKCEENTQMEDERRSINSISIAVKPKGKDEMKTMNVINETSLQLILNYGSGVIRLGEHNTETNPDCDGDFCSDPVLDVVPSEILIPKHYGSPPYKHDIALIRLAKEIKFSSSVKPICFSNGEFTKKNFVGRVSEVAGWGIYDLDDPKASVKLQVVKLFIVKNEECEKHFSDFTDIGPTQMCAGGVVGKDSCNGDSGGPLMIVDDGVNGPGYYLLGIVSFGYKECGKTDSPAVYTKMTSYMEWFLDNLVEKTTDSEKVL